MDNPLVATVEKCTKTLRLKVKPEADGWLRAAAFEVNQVWNYCNEASAKAARPYYGKARYLSGFDLVNLTAGACLLFPHIRSGTVSRVCTEFAAKRFAAKRSKLSWRKSGGAKRSLGWIPFRKEELKRKGSRFTFCGKAIRVFEFDRVADLQWGDACLAEDATGDWWLCLPVKTTVEATPAPLSAVGIDLGLKDIATTSDGESLAAGKFYRGLEKKISQAQRRGHKRQAKLLGRKAANCRKDALHKFTTGLVRRYQFIAVGDVSSVRMAKTRMAKSVLDSGWGMLKTNLIYKGQQAGRWVQVVDERYTSRACSNCGCLSGPKGLDMLAVRAWMCGECGSSHDRDINAAKNILARAKALASVSGNEGRREVTL